LSAAASDATTPQSTKVTIYPAGTTLKTQSGDSSHSSPSISWDPTQYQLQSATLVLTASQSAELGADCWVGMNEMQVPKLALNWAADTTNEQTVQADVTSMLCNGANDFWVHYDATQLPFTSTTLTFGMTLQVVLTYIGTGTPSTNPITTGPSLTMPNLPWYYWVAIAGGVVALIAVLYVMSRRRKA
jgi:hypothetical protein